MPAAFRRLCVETGFGKRRIFMPRPAAFRRLCVETPTLTIERMQEVPAAFRRLCVETDVIDNVIMPKETSRLQAAVC